MTNATERKFRFATVVPTVDKFPLAIMIFGCLLLVINVLGFYNFLFNLSGFSPEIGTGPSVNQVAIMFAGRQLAITVVFALALFGKNTRFMQLGWFIAIIREIADIAGAFVKGDFIVAGVVLAILIAEIAVFIYVGRIASGHVAKYKTQA